jgi:hypothetical protein
MKTYSNTCAYTGIHSIATGYNVLPSKLAIATGYNVLPSKLAILMISIEITTLNFNYNSA